MFLNLTRKLKRVGKKKGEEEWEEGRNRERGEYLCQIKPE